MALVDHVLDSFRAAVTDIFGDRVERVVLYGSRARGDAQSDSDYDVAVFIEGLTSRWHESKRLAQAQIATLEETGATVNALLYPAGHWRDEASTLMGEIRADGVDL